MRTVKVGLIGLGTVGGGVVRILTEGRELLRQRTGVDIELARVVDKRPERADELGLDRAMLSGEADWVLAEPSIDIVVELIGGLEPARRFVLAALAAGKDVVTANKALIAAHGGELLDAAEAAGRDLLFEASVGGGIPIVHPLKESLAGNRFDEVLGIVNGTTNFILSEMSGGETSFADALAEAQRRGYAEADPTADVDGLDAQAKIAILARIAFNSRVGLEEIPTEGIAHITPKDMVYAADMGYAIKLLALARRVEGGLDVRVHPAMIPLAHPLAGVDGVYNGIFVVGDSVGPVLFWGQGAGSLPAASAVVGDIVDAARGIAAGCPGMTTCSCFDHLPVIDPGDVVSKNYVLLRAADEAGVLAAVARAFADEGVSIASVIQRETDESGADLVFVTHKVQERGIRKALQAIGSLPVVQAVASVIKVEELTS
jgi:homoserine dehydrogenase